MDRTKTSQIGIAHIIGKKDQDIRGIGTLWFPVTSADEAKDETHSGNQLYQ
jgi:hypothetical protein